MRSNIYNIIDFENSRKRECESDYFNSKFFEMFPTKYEKLLREYEVILFKDNVKISFLSMDFSDDFLYDGEYSFVERIFLTLFGIIRLKDSEKSFDNLFFLNEIDKGVYFADDMVLFSFELVKVANSFDEFMDNIEKFNLASYSRFFKK